MVATRRPFLFVPGLVVPGFHAFSGEPLVDRREDLIVTEKRDILHRVVMTGTLVVQVVGAGAPVVAVDEEVGAPLADDVPDVVWICWGARA